MKTPFILLCAIGTILTGCTAPFRASRTHIKLETVDSPVVIMDQISLDRRTGVPTLIGAVAKRTEIQDTTRTHLDVILYDAAGLVLRSTMEHFEPRQIPSRYSWPNYATYRVSLDPLPEGTARIEVRAREDANPSQ